MECVMEQSRLMVVPLTLDLVRDYAVATGISRECKGPGEAMELVEGLCCGPDDSLEWCVWLPLSVEMVPDGTSAMATLRALARRVAFDPSVTGISVAGTGTVRARTVGVPAVRRADGTLAIADLYSGGLCDVNEAIGRVETAIGRLGTNNTYVRTHLA